MPKPHWVSRFLTAPWETNFKGDLAFYNFKLDKFGKPTPSARLFREQRKRRPELERRLNKLVETPLARARARLTAPEPVAIEDWETFRAVALLLFLQVPRAAAAATRDDSVLAPLIMVSDTEIDQMTWLITRKKQLVRLGTTNAEHPMFYPDIGMFHLLTRDDGCLTGWSWGMAIPWTPFMAYAWVSDTASCDWLFEQCTTSPYLQAFSVNGPRVTRVVLPPWLNISENAQRWLRQVRDEGLAYRREVQRRRAEHLDGLRKEGKPLAVLDRGAQRYGYRTQGDDKNATPVDVWSGDFEEVRLI